MTRFQKLMWDRVAIGACVLCTIGVSGCFSDSDVISQDRGAVVAPDAFEDERQTWTSAGRVSESDMQRLTTYFAGNPSVAENTIVRGDPLIYATADGNRRYYWVRPGRDGAEWFCLQFGKRSIQMKDGSGAPFAGR